MFVKRFNISIIILCILFITVGCSKTSSPVPSASAAKKDIPQAPTRTAEIYGKVKSVIGNEVTLSLAEPPANQQLNQQLSEAEKAKKRAEMQALSPEERAKQQESQTKLTGETATVIIPVGTPITSGNTPELMKEVSLPDIRSGVLLRIWLEGGNGGDKSAEYVRLLQAQ